MPLDVPGSPLTPREKQVALAQRDWGMSEKLLIVSGLMPEDPDAKAARLKREWSLRGRNLADLAFDVRWDTNPENFFRACDGLTPDKFDAQHPNLVLRWVEVEALSPVLHCRNQRSADELWSPEFASKNAGVLLHWIEGGSITPPLVAPHDGAVFVAGGNHRLSIAILAGERHVPFLLSGSHVAAIDALVPLAEDEPASAST